MKTYTMNLFDKDTKKEVLDGLYVCESTSLYDAATKYLIDKDLPGYKAFYLCITDKGEWHTVVQVEKKLNNQNRPVLSVKKLPNLPMEEFNVLLDCTLQK